ncbi:hypothetical protein FPE01S_01_01190 [Flavihumibacter petaseus NBRC 106054]|uniref:Outer membrane protein beta-barrel domain-containing protein n=2 Tax=Flavihumibacter TaxID=1004301 RepID=A0A0E9MTL6_9BACT|nr:hypothetical protein FPE01S_01_01190 [Flavihumibacter petaseus NBRC 106054]
MPLGDKHRQYYDSLKNMNYDRIFPILGKKAYKAGFDIPFPVGIMLNSFYAVQGIDISNIRIGIKGEDNTLGPVDMSEIIKFQEVTAKGLNANIRADVWVLPFLNVYGILGALPHAQTRVVLAEPVSITSQPVQSGWNYGIGLMGAGGVGPVFIQGDFNYTWSHLELLENVVKTKVAGIRVGHNFRLRNPEQNVTVWAGAMGIFLNNETKGQISIADLFPDLTQQQIDDIKNSYANWHDDLGPLQKEVVDKIVDKMQAYVDGSKGEDTYITYEMDKKPSSRWAGLVGAQLQFSKRWQLRVESNFISGGERYSLLASVNYRFLGPKSKKP